MKRQPLGALLGPLAALVVMAAFGAYTSLGHLGGFSSSERALVFVALALLGILLGILVGAAGTQRSSRPTTDQHAAELSHQVQEFITVAVPAAVQAALDNPGAELPALPALDQSGPPELASLARAMQALGNAAVALAAEQTALRQSFAEAFVNLGRRNQNLVTRQLEYISELELGEAEPQKLDQLFRLDHLATRMRRNAESLLILAGSGPARQWDAPVPAMDIARAASAEVEDYKRLRLHHFDPAMISGSATTDLVHILAELMEDALAFSPPGSQVDVYGRFLEGGYVVVIVDSGIGMGEEELARANRRLAGETLEQDLPGRYLGHFVAGRLSARHGVSASLQPSHSSGLVARVKVPSELVEEPTVDLPQVPAAQPAPAPSYDPGPLSPADLASAFEPAPLASTGPAPAFEPAPLASTGPPPAFEPASLASTGPAPAFEPGYAALPDSAPTYDPAPLASAHLAPASEPAALASTGATPAFSPAALGHEPGPPSYGSDALVGALAEPARAAALAPDLGPLSPLARALADPEPRQLAGQGDTPSPDDGVGPAAQARTTADALRKLTRRVPGAALGEEDGTLRRDTPAAPNVDASVVRSALFHYLSTTNRSNGTEHNQP